MENSIKDHMNGYGLLAQENAKAEYIERCSKMTWHKLFDELMRVHAQSARMLNEAYAELDRVNALLNRDEDGDSIPPSH
jgi:hypothetical protein